jgi:leucyl-tRNA---protein transferase
MKGSDLDLYLSLGYFRMHQTVFTCRYVVFDTVFSPVFWLRIDLVRAELGSKQRALLRIRNKFSVRVKPFKLSPEVEALYASYRNSIDFDAPGSVAECLFNGSSTNVFDTYCVEIRDNERLIAVGVFDNGLISIAGIMNFFDPAYRKYSLGKCLMLLKMEYAKTQQKAYYYPGYIASAYPKLNYKLFACETATELYDDYTDLWYPFSWERIATMTEESPDKH